MRVASSARGLGVGQRREALAGMLVVALAAASLASCGTSKATETANPSAGGSSSSASSTSSSTRARAGLPDPCSLASESQIDAALGVAVNKVTRSVNPAANGQSELLCTWTLAAPTIVNGLGSTVVVEIYRSVAGLSQSQYYKVNEQTTPFHFVPVAIDGIPAIESTDPTQTLVDVGPVTVTVSAVPTTKSANPMAATVTITRDVVERLCALRYCRS